MCVHSQSCPTLGPHELYLTRHLCPWDFLGKNTGVGGHFLLQGIFLTRESNPQLLCPRDFLGKNTGVGCHFLLQFFKF